MFLRRLNWQPQSHAPKCIRLTGRPWAGLEDQRTQLFPRACTSIPPSASPPSLTGESRGFPQTPHLCDGTVVVAHQEDDPPAAMHGRVLLQDASDQVVEALDQPRTGEGLRDSLRKRLSAQLLRGHAIGIGHVDDGLAAQCLRAASSNQTTHLLSEKT